MAILIDTDLLIDLERGVGAPAVERMLGEEDRAISVITVSELLHGVHRATGPRRARRSAFVEHLLAGMRAIPITDAVARVHADLWAQLSDHGEHVGAHDLWIGATALAHGLAIATGNLADFQRIPGLRVIGGGPHPRSRPPPHRADPPPRSGPRSDRPLTLAFPLMAAREPVSIDLDADVAAILRTHAAEAHLSEGEIVDRAIRAYDLRSLIADVRLRSDLDQDQAMALAREELRAARAERDPPA